MLNVNRWRLAGYANKDAVFRSPDAPGHVPDVVVPFTVNRDRRAENGEYERVETLWCEVGFYNGRNDRTGETYVPYKTKLAGDVRKGDFVDAEGIGSINTWTDNEGNLRTTVRLLNAGDKMHAFSVTPGSGGSAKSRAAKAPAQEQDPEDAATQSDIEEGEDLPW